MTVADTGTGLGLAHQASARPLVVDGGATITGGGD